MKTRLLPAVLATTLALTTLTPTANTAELTPDDIRGTTPVATLEANPHNTDTQPPVWRDTIQTAQIAGKNVEEIWAYSPSMARSIPLVVIHADNTTGPRPIIYLLNGGDGGENEGNWVMQTDVIDFYRDKNINVVIPMEGKYSYYVDWIEEPSELGGKQLWETFLTKELPQPIENYLNTNGQRAIAGMSMSATASLLFPSRHPGFYDAAASYSGCAQTSDPAGNMAANLTLLNGGLNIDTTLIWGSRGSERNRENDAYINAENLKGTELYISNGTGIPGDLDMPTNQRFHNMSPEQLATEMADIHLGGAAIEAATNACTHNLKTHMDNLQIPVDWNLRPVGTHSWAWWQQDLRDSWPTFERAFNQ